MQRFKALTFNIATFFLSTTLYPAMFDKDKTQAPITLRKVASAELNESFSSLGSFCSDQDSSCAHTPILIGNEAELDAKIKETCATHPDVTILHILCRLHCNTQYEIELIKKRIIELVANNQLLINSKDKNGHTPLSYACYFQNYHLISFLVNLGADCTIIDHLGNSMIDIVKFHLPEDCEFLTIIQLKRNGATAKKSARADLDTPLTPQLKTTNKTTCCC